MKLSILGLEVINTEVPVPVPKQEKLFDVLGGLVDLGAGRLSNEKSVSTKLLQANRGWVYRNNDAIAKEVSKMEFELYTIGLSEGEIVYNEVQTHPLLDLLDKFNEEMTTSDALYLVQSHKKLTGDAFLLKVRKGQKIVALRLLPPDKVELNLRNPSANDPTIVESYTYKDSIDGKKIEVTYKPQDIIHLKTPNPNNQFRGLGAVEAMADTIDLDNLATEVNKRYFLNGAIHSFALTTENKITRDQLKMLKAELRQSLQGVKNAFSVPVFGGGLTPMDISYSNKEAEYLAQLEWYRDKIMYGFGNTKSSLGILEDVNRSTNESAIVEWQRNTVKPDMQAICDTLNEFLVPEYGDNLILGFCDPVPEDHADDIAEVRDLYPLGIMTLNEARGAVDLDVVDEGGDEFYSAPTPVVNDPGVINENT